MSFILLKVVPCLFPSCLSVKFEMVCFIHVPRCNGIYERVWSWVVGGGSKRTPLRREGVRIEKGLGRAAEKLTFRLKKQED